MFGATFNVVARIGQPQYLEQCTSLTTLASNNCLYHRNVFQSGVNYFSKMVNHCQKAQNFVYFVLFDFA